MYDEAEAPRPAVDQFSASDRQRIRAAQAEQPKVATPLGGQCATARLTASDAIERRIENLHRETQGLYALLRALPRELSREADEALWYLVTNRQL